MTHKNRESIVWDPKSIVRYKSKIEENQSYQITKDM